MKKLIFFVSVFLFAIVAGGNVFALDRFDGGLSAEESGGAIPLDECAAIPAEYLMSSISLVQEYAGAAAYTSGRSSRKGSWSVGGSIGATFGDNTGITIAPQVGYNWGGIVTVGGGISYSYLKYDYYGTDYSINLFGANVFTRVYVFRGFFLFAQPELYRRLDSIKNGPKADKTFACLLLGGGVSIPVGGRSSMNIAAFYDVVQNEYTPYSDNVSIQVGFSFGL